MKLDFLILIDNLLADNQSGFFSSSLFTIIDKEYKPLWEKNACIICK